MAKPRLRWIQAQNNQNRGVSIFIGKPFISLLAIWKGLRGNVTFVSSKSFPLLMNFNLTFKNNILLPFKL